MPRLPLRLVCTIALLVPHTTRSAQSAVREPAPTIPGARSAVVMCDVTPEKMTAHCGGAPEPALIRDVNVRPEHLAGAVPGTRVEVVVRRIPGKRSDPARSVEPIDWAPPPPANAPALIVDPIWRVLPSADQLKLFYPDRAYRLGINGDAAATCSVGPGGDLVGCWLTSEAPQDQGFGFALLKMTTCLQVEPVTKGGQSTPGRIIKVGAHFTVGKRQALAVQLVLLPA